MLIAKVGLGLVLAGSGIAAVVTSGGATALAPQQPSLPGQAVVSALGDAGSFEVTADGSVTRIRLTDIAVPAAPVAGQPGQCLGVEATAFLAGLAPVGTPLTLTYDVDRFGRQLAAATTPDGRLLNAELARAGFAEPTTVDPDHPDRADGPDARPAVEAGVRDAAASRRGLHSPAVACTVPGQVKTVLDAAARIPAEPRTGARGAQLHTAAAAASAARAAADELLWGFEQNRREITWRVLDQATRDDLRRQLVAARDRAASAEVALRNAASATFNQEATALAVRTEDLRVAREQAKIRAAEARRLALVARRAEAARQARAAAARSARQRAESERASERAAERVSERESSRNSNRSDSERGGNRPGRDSENARDR